MDHTEITDRGFVELYHRGQLSPEDEERFEEHFFACEQCQRDLELARSMGRGFTAMEKEDAAETALAPTVPLPAGPSAAAPDLSRSNVTSIADRRAGGVRRWLPLARAAAVTAVLMGLPLLWLGGENDRLAEQARSLRQRVDEAERTAAAAGERLTQSERRLAEERELARRQSEEAEPGRSKEPVAPGPGQLAETVPPSGTTRFATAVLLLSAVRGETDASPLLDLGTAAGPVALAVDVEDDPRFASYRLTLRDSKGRILLTQGDVRRNALETLLVTLPAGFLHPGRHTLAVEGLAAGGATAEVGRFAFLVK
jgi:Putative zinc-finger